jgi:hypothetical protein
LSAAAPADRVGVRIAARLCRGVLIAYVILATAALLLIPASAAGLFGLSPDPLSGIYAIALALPWSIVAPWPDAAGLMANLLVIAAELALNAAIIWAACRGVRRLWPRRN